WSTGSPERLSPSGTSTARRHWQSANQRDQTRPLRHHPTALRGSRLSPLPPRPRRNQGPCPPLLQTRPTRTLPPEAPSLRGSTYASWLLALKTLRSSEGEPYMASPGSPGPPLLTRHHRRGQCLQQSRTHCRSPFPNH